MNAVRVEADLDNSTHVAMYEEMLDDCYEHFSMGEMTFYPSDILKSCDPIAYRVGFNDFFDDETILLWNCSECGEVHDSEDSAEDCCKIACENCGTLWNTEDEAEDCCKIACENCGTLWNTEDEAKMCCFDDSEIEDDDADVDED